MILNVSGRTDIVAFYTGWFINRYKEGYVDVRNPFYPNNVSRIYFKDVDAIIFCTKNPLPILKFLNEIKQPILFHITLTPYKKDIEPNVPPKGKIIEGIKQLSKIIEIDNIFVRYDPIFFNEKYNLEYHIKAFDNMCKLLKGYVKHIIISFIDEYKNVKKNFDILKIKTLSSEDYRKIGINFSKSAKENGMTIQTCCEEQNLVQYGFIKRDCLDFNLAYKITKKTNLKKWKERNCNCVEMVDIGCYNSCLHFCKYCYANYDEEKVYDNISNHDEKSSLLVGKIVDNDNIKIRKI